MQRNKADSGIRVGAAVVDPGVPRLEVEADMSPNRVSFAVCQCHLALWAIQKLGTDFI